MAHTYIIFSPSLNRYYVGATNDDIQERIRRHNSNHKGYTGKANDWVLALAEPCETLELAMRREREIKAWKSRKRIETLIKSKP